MHRLHAPGTIWEHNGEARAALRRNDWPIIVGGCHRSGTSLVRRILNAHSRIYCGPEVKFFRDFYGDYPDDPLHHLRFMSSARALLPEAKLLQVLGKAYIAVVQQAASSTGKVRWADKNPENIIYLAGWQQLLGGRWFLIQVVRNPLDTIASVKEAGFTLTIPEALDERIAFYRRYTQAGLEFAAAHPGRYCRILYEELVRSPEVTLRSLMQRLGERFEPGQLAFNNVPQQGGLEDPKVALTTCVHANSTGRWTAVLSCEEASVIWRHTKDLWAALDPDGRCEAQFMPPSGTRL